MNNHQALAITALRIAKDVLGDELVRARHHYKNFPSERRADIIAKHEARDAEIEAAIEWVKAQNE